MARMADLPGERPAGRDLARLLRAAACSGRVSEIRRLAEDGVDLDDTERRPSALFYAAWSSQGESLKVLLALGADPRRTHSASPKKTAVLGALHGFGARAGPFLSLLKSAGADLDAGEGSALSTATRTEELNEASYSLLRLGASPRACGGRSLIHAAVRGDTRVARALLQHGADPNDGAAFHDAVCFSRRRNPDALETVSLLLDAMDRTPTEPPRWVELCTNMEVLGLLVDRGMVNYHVLRSSLRFSADVRLVQRILGALSNSPESILPVLRAALFQAWPSAPALRAVLAFDPGATKKLALEDQEVGARGASERRLLTRYARRGLCDELHVLVEEFGFDVLHPFYAEEALRASQEGTERYLRQVHGDSVRRLLDIFLSHCATFVARLRFSSACLARHYLPGTGAGPRLAKLRFAQQSSDPCTWKKPLPVEIRPPS